tara:strand:+ start:179 stop:397 length:219 start_codon:yes stop_codon:yes gene_type:complete
MAMSRKHYVAVADALKAERTAWRDGNNGAIRTNAAELAVGMVATRLAQIFEADNPNFDTGRFIEAASLPYTE